MQPTKLYESLFILHKCNQTINMLWDIIETNQKQIKKIEGYGTLFTNYVKMEAISFQNELDIGFFHSIEEEYKAQMNDVRTIVAPIRKRINKWKDLEKFRNNIIAHPWRHKGKFVVPHRQYYNVPRNWFEVGVLVKLINYIWAIVENEFQNEFAQAIPYIAGLEPQKAERADYSNLNSDHIAMAEEVDQICQKFGKPYFLKVMQFEFDNNE